MPRVTIQLFGGEKDGHTTRVVTRGDLPPEVFYVWRNADDEKLHRLSATDRARVVRKLSVLAYRRDDNAAPPDIDGTPSYRYLRHAEADKAVSDTV